VLARVLELVREVVVALLWIEERSDAEVDARDVREDRGAKRNGAGRCDIGGGGGGGTRRVVAVVDEDDDEPERAPSFGEEGTERGRCGGVGVVTGKIGDLERGLCGNFGGLSCLALFIASPQSNTRVDAVVGLKAETFSNDSSKLLASPLSPLLCRSIGNVAM
jgi:hypothetical protein